jgi:TIR domain
VNCTSSDYHLLPAQVPRLPAGNVSYVLDFSNSKNLSRIDWRPYHVNTSVISVSGCAVVTVDEKLWNGTRFLNALLLDHNQMQSLPLSIETNRSPSAKLSLGNNLWTCYCNDSWMIAWLNRIKDRLIDSIDIQCHTPSHLREKSILQLTPDDFCSVSSEEIFPKFGTFSLLATVLFLIMLTLFGASLYRVRVQLYMKWNIHPFDQDECIGEDMEYDVFLSSSSQDYETHTRNILDELESRGFKVCFHERDFHGGESIEVNMCRAIERSKRTLCLVSENFLRRFVSVTVPCKLMRSGLQRQLAKLNQWVTYKTPQRHQMLPWQKQQFTG